MERHQPGELGDRLGVPSQRHFDEDSLFEDSLVALGEVITHPVGVRPRYTLQRRAAPAVQRRRERARGTVRVAAVPGLFCGRHVVVERAQVELARFGVQQIAARRGDDGIRWAQRPTQPDHVGGDEVAGAGRREITPDPRDDLVP